MVSGSGDGNGDLLKQDFDALLGDLDYPLFIVTTRSGAGDRAGCLVGFATQCSIAPSRFLVCISRANRTCRVALQATLLAVHLVPSSAKGLAELFGAQTGDEVDKFARCEWQEGRGGVPILDRCESWFLGKILDRHDLGDHLGFLLAPIEVRRAIPVAQFSFQRAKRIDAGHDA